MMNSEQRVATDDVPVTGVASAPALPGALPVRIEAAGLTNVGKRRSSNEDHYIIASFAKAAQLHDTNLDDRSVFDRLQRPPAQLMVVADGVGGKVGGRIASSMTVETIAEYLGGIVGCYHRFDVDGEHAFLEHLSTAIQQAHSRLQDEFPGRRGAATTVTMATIVWPRTYLVHAGDSRAYYLRRGRLRQITQDQTMGDVMVDLGAISEEDARKRGLYSVLSSAVGSDLSPVVGLIDLEPDDVLLLCTDGLTTHVPDERIAERLIKSPTADAACQSLVDAALDGGGSDNITVVVARFPRIT
jgi:serine/threonine protein phosphatase PrpC